MIKIKFTFTQLALVLSVLLSLLIASISPPISYWVAVFYLGQATGFLFLTVVETSTQLIERTISWIFRDKIDITME